MSKNGIIVSVTSGIDKSIAKIIKTQLQDLPLKSATLDGEYVDGSVRNSQVSWIPKTHWVAGLMSHYVNLVNDQYYHYDLRSWAQNIQYTVYNGQGTGYKWHNDYQEALEGYDLMRKITISLCLDDEYEGGELQIFTPGCEMNTYKMNCGDIVIFSSDMMHRVRPLKSGLRTCLVGWYAGPKFK